MFNKKCRCSETIIPQYDRLLEQLRLQVNDLLEQQIKLQQQWDKERQGLLTQLSEVALPQLVALRNPRPPAPGNPRPEPPKPFFPGYNPDRRPPTPSAVKPEPANGS